MGEIGRDRREFLFEMSYCDIYLIIQGYRRRERTFCTMTRWATFMQMSTGMADLKKAGIYQPEDILKFPWEMEGVLGSGMTQEQIEQERASIIEENKRIEQSKGTEG